MRVWTFKDAGLGYAGWVLPAKTWRRLDPAALEAHQARTSHRASEGLLRRVLPFAGRYVNSVLFLPDGRRPGEPPAASGAVRDHGGHVLREAPRAG